MLNDFIKSNFTINIKFIKHQFKLLKGKGLVFSIINFISFIVFSCLTFWVIKKGIIGNENQTFDFTKIKGIWQIFTLFVVTIFLGFNLLVVNTILTKEIARGYFSSGSTLPISRKSILNSKLVVIFSFLFLTILQLMIIIFIFEYFTSSLHLSLLTFLLYYFALATLVIAIIGFCATVTNKIGYFVVYLAIVVMLEFIINFTYAAINGKLVSEIKPFGYNLYQGISLTTIYYSLFEPASGNYAGQIPTMILAATSLIMTGNEYFSKKDLAL